MLAQSRDSFEEEFGRPVESIMRCEDFKSNFARRLSNRYISKSPVAVSRADNVNNTLKLRPMEKREILKNVPERIEQCSQLSKSNNVKQNGEVAKPPDKQTTNNSNSNSRQIKVEALNMEVETLRWQLTQTEANRQMHIALLKQIVTFLSRVKEHIEFQSSEPGVRLDNLSSNVLPSSLNITDLPRSRSVFHVSKNLDYSISPSKKMSTRKISKSISNVNGYKDCSSSWNNSKLSLVSENETSLKLTEEMTRLITLANTVLSTKIPDLASAYPNNSPPALQLTEDIKKAEITLQSTTDSLSMNGLNETDTTVLNTTSKVDSHNGITNKFGDIKNRINDFIVSQCPLSCGSENDSSVVLFEQPGVQNGLVTTCGKVVQTVDKRNDYNASSNFVEDESGFSSMSSFQEIGIPIISIIPPSPCKEVEYFEGIGDETEKWKTDAIELDKQSIKVFWV
ncbi:uncharacterized protein LOC116777820 [Danaus plexippus]|uniref:uncharacterized protein LOC116777820 n=1 Tax=Danaus plexippus TaxID=13037 RepID=UPI002AAF698C|nr:uncharacterized protein LOC116777820 [Danaus plexippus]